MDISVEFDLDQVAKELDLPSRSVLHTVELLDEGNTVPFITRYRKERTGALDEEQVRRIQTEVGRLRALIERKQAVLKSIQSQGKLTESLIDQIRAANTPKRLEDLYLPFKPKKQTLATVARQRGLEPFAHEVFDADPVAADLRQHAAEFVAIEKELHTADDVLVGVGHILAEWFSERADVRGRLRRIMRQTGRLVCRRAEVPKRDVVSADVAPKSPVIVPVKAEKKQPPTDEAAVSTEQAESPADEPVIAEQSDSSTDEAAVSTEQAESPADEPGTAEQAELPTDELTPTEQTESPTDEAAVSTEQAESPADEPGTAEQAESPTDVPVIAEQSDSSTDELTPTEQTESSTDEAAVSTEQAESPTDGQPTDGQPAEMEPDKLSGTSIVNETESDQSGSKAVSVSEDSVPDVGVGTVNAPNDGSAEKPAASDQTPSATGGSVPAASGGRRKKERISKKEKKRKKLEAAFKDYFSYEESIAKLPHHRILATNRGERAKILRARIDVDQAALLAEAERLLVPPDHPHLEFLRDCVRDALSRLLLPSLEREIRREMTERAETHATEVFARNLRKLLLQPPVYGRRVLAVDPGFRSGCKLIALDEFGNVLDKGIIHVIGREERIRNSRVKLAGLVKKHQLSVIAIGNGTACRETEQLVVEIMGDELKDDDVAFVIVNEAGASVYSTSPSGREELPSYDAVLRSAISIGRRLLDPLSELVKINPANIGVGMYQHDVKAKYLRDSLDAVVESCVNFVGVDVNTASPALLRYVSGLNQLTARRLCEYREKHGPFTSREQFKQVSGVGETTFVQAAGFLKITNGETPLDATWIHPESYSVARMVLDRLGCSDADLEVSSRASDPKHQKVWPTEALQQIVGQVVQQPAEVPAEEVAAEEVAAEEVAAEEVAVEEVAVEEVPAEEVPVEEAVVEEVPVEEAVAGDPSPEAVMKPAEEGMESGPELPRSDSLPAVDTVDTPTAGSSTDTPAPVELSVEPVGGAEGGSRQSLAEMIRAADVGSLSGALQVSELLLSDILNSLARPGRDPREDLPAPIFRRGIVKLEDLESGMRLTGTVLNVVDFGAFVDIGLSDSGLIHISRLADRFVRDPHDVVGVGDIMTVWVMEVDKKRRRVSLTAVEPGTEKPREQRHSPRKSQPHSKGSSRPDEVRRTAGRRRGSQGRDQKRSHTVRKPKVVTPITKEMEDGKAPLRSFSDLMQFYDKQPPDQDKKSS